MSRDCYIEMPCPSFFPVDGSCEDTKHDIKIVNGGMAEGNAAISSVLIQLHTNKQVDGEGGFWADEFEDFSIGNRLWTFLGTNITDDITVRVDEAVREALEPLIDQGLFDEIYIRSVRVLDGVETTLDLVKDGQSIVLEMAI